MLNRFKNDKNLCLNVVRILSKLQSGRIDPRVEVSTQMKANDQMFALGASFVDILCQVFTTYFRDNQTIAIRAAFVLGNLTTDYSEARTVILSQKYFVFCLNISEYLFKPEEKENKKKQMNSTEDFLTKVIRLVANLLTEEEVKKDLPKMHTQIITFFRNGLRALKEKTLE